MCTPGCVDNTLATHHDVCTPRCVDTGWTIQHLLHSVSVDTMLAALHAGCTPRWLHTTLAPILGEWKESSPVLIKWFSGTFKRKPSTSASPNRCKPLSGVKCQCSRPKSTRTLHLEFSTADITKWPQIYARGAICAYMQGIRSLAIAKRFRNNCVLCQNVRTIFNSTRRQYLRASEI